MNEDKISVIIILYFSKHLVPGIILNIRQCIKNLGEIILINNSGENIGEFEAKDILIVYPNKNLGYGAAINLGVKASKYKYLLILNPDVEIKKFNISLDALNKEFIISGNNPDRPGYSLKFPTLLNSFFEYAIIEHVYIESIDKLQYKRMNNELEENEVDYISGALIFTNKHSFNKIGGFDSSFFLFYEETDFCKRACNLKIPVISTSKIIYQQKQGKASAINVSEIKIKSGIDSCKKYHSKYDGILATKIVFFFLKLIYATIILVMSPLCFAGKVKAKRNEFIMRINFF